MTAAVLASALQPLAFRALFLVFRRTRRGLRAMRGGPRERAMFAILAEALCRAAAAPQPQ